MNRRYHQHDFDRIEDYLHHRPPFLLVDRIVAIGDSEIRTEAIVDRESFYSAGHFPGVPILPGSIMQEMSTQSAGIFIAARYNPMEHFNTSDPFHNEYALGVLVKVKRARYHSFARPGDTISIQVRLKEKVDELFDFACTIRLHERKIMRNEFQLTNIPSSALRGPPNAAT